MVLLLLVLGMVALALPGGASRPARMRAGMALVLLFTGTDHLVNSWRYLPMMPEIVPWPRFVVLFTGLCEILGGLGLLVPRTRRLAGIMLAVFFVCVLPANINAAWQGIRIPGLEAPDWVYWARIPLQAVVCWWALYAACVINWPGGPASTVPSPPAGSPRAAPAAVLRSD
jgi:uncharacterized membrane protein